MSDSPVRPAGRATSRHGVPTSLVILSVVALAAACDPILSVQGRVDAVPTESPSSVGGTVNADREPVENATVTVFCPREGEWIAFNAMKTNADGVIDTTVIGAYESGCELRISKEGFREAALPFEEICVRELSGGRCTAAEFDVELVPDTDTTM